MIAVKMNNDASHKVHLYMN